MINILVEKGDSFTTEQTDDVQNSDRKSTSYCVSLIEIVSPTFDEISETPEKIRKFYTIFVNILGQIVIQHNGELLNMAGDTLKSYVPQTSNRNDLGTIKNVLECCLMQIESRQSISDELTHEGLPGISYKVTAEMDPHESLDMIPDFPLINKISERIPTNNVSLGKDLYKVVSTFPQLQEYFF